MDDASRPSRSLLLADQEVWRRTPFRKLPPPAWTPYRRWLEALVERFGAETVGSWDREPVGWTFAEWSQREQPLHVRAGA